MAFRERKKMDVEKPAVPVSKLYEVNECGSSSSSSKLIRNRNKSQGSEQSCVQLAKDFVSIRRMVGDLDDPNVGGGSDCFQSTPKGGELGRKNALHCSPNDSGYSTTKSFVSSFLSDHSPFRKDRSRLFEVEEPLKPQAWVPFVLLFVVLTSSVVAIFTFSSAVQRQQGGETGYVPGGKYRAIEFAHSRRMKREAEDAVPDLEGNEVAAVGDVEVGKGEKDYADEGEVEVFDSLEFIQELQNYAEQRLKEAQEAKKKELVKKIGSFGHFATSVVKPLDLDNDKKAAAEEEEPSRKKRNSRSPNKKENPFRFNEQSKAKKKAGDFRAA